MRLAAAAPALMLLALASPSSAAERGVSIPGKLFEPERLEVLVGDTVTWRNLDAVTHTVTADNATFDSGDLVPDGTYSITFDRPGRTTYHCAIHRFMTGEVDVFALALSGPLDPVPVGTRFALHGLASPGTELVTIERQMPSGEFVRETTANAGPGGAFRVSISAATSSDYRAIVGTLASSVVHVNVSPRITLRAQSVGRHVLLEALASPAQPGIPANLESYSREHFTWFKFASMRFDARSRLHLSLSPTRPLRLRVVLLKASDGLVGGTSNVVVVRVRERTPR